MCILHAPTVKDLSCLVKIEIRGFGMTMKMGLNKNNENGSL